jgi:hypothetical protein
MTTLRAAVVIISGTATLIAPIAGCHDRPADTRSLRAPAKAPEAPAPPVNEIDGAYQVVTGRPDDTHSNRWVFASCGNGCAQVDIPDGGSTNHGMARYVNQQWVINVHTRAAIQCGDGSFAGGTEHFSWNPDTLKGRYWSSSDAQACGQPEPFDTDPVPLTLTRSP